MLSKVPIFTGLNQGLEGAEGRGMFIKQNYISCKKKMLIATGRAPLKNEELLGVFKVKFIPTANGRKL